jgi:endonuclease/exonuclease/phosphatase family metal-dependent hydrolase
MNRRIDYGSSTLALTSALLLASGDAASLGHAGRMTSEGGYYCGTTSASLAFSSCVGAPALAPLEAQGLAPAEAGTFNLLTYNVAGLPDAISPSHPATNMPLISPLLNHYDLALVQEDFYYHAELIGQTRHAYRSEQVMGFAMPGDGLAVLSKFVLGQMDRVRWTDCNGYVLDASDCLADKGFSFGEIALAAGVTLHAYNVHADAGRSPSDEWVRRSNFEQLVTFIKARSNGHALIVAGDTNLHHSSPEDAATLARFVAALELEDACGRRHHAEEAGIPPAARTRYDEDGIDRVLFRSSVRTQLAVSGCRRDSRFVDPEGRALSDHAAIGAEFSWRLQQPPAAQLVMSH